MASAGLRGLVIMSLADPAIGRRRIRARPFGAAEAAEWTPPGLAMASLAQAFFEPDPAIVWDEERVALILQALE